ncbi:MAG: hypothetical protein ABJE87_07550 [Roseobacter sp.]
MTVFRTLKCVTLLFLSFGFLGCTFGPSPQSLQADPSATPTLETARTVFEDRTRITHDPWYGTQIEYHRSDGKSFLWFPRNTRPVPANWEVRNHGFGQGGHEICWQYPSTSKNAVTGAKGGNWECYPDSTYNANLTAVLQGDPFDLASNRVPFRIPSTR